MHGKTTATNCFWVVRWAACPLYLSVSVGRRHDAKIDRRRRRNFAGAADGVELMSDCLLTPPSVMQRSAASSAGRCFALAECSSHPPGHADLPVDHPDDAIAGYSPVRLGAAAHLCAGWMSSISSDEWPTSALHADTWRITTVPLTHRHHSYPSHTPKTRQNTTNNCIIICFNCISGSCIKSVRN